MLRFWQSVKEELDFNLMTQKELAEKIGISYNTLQSWISKNRLPDAEQALKIASALDSSIEYLLTGKCGDQKGINPKLQDLLPTLNRLSKENLDLIGLLAEKLK